MVLYQRFLPNPDLVADDHIVTVIILQLWQIKKIPETLYQGAWVSPWKPFDVPAVIYVRN